MTRLETRLQERLQSLYHVDGPPAVGPFCVDAAVARALAPNASNREALLVRSAGGHVELALHIAASVRAGALSFLAELHLGRDASWALDPFCAAFEGISHFVYLTFTGSQGRGVSRLELELQAEIDKYFFLRFALGIGGPEVVERLFTDFRWAHPLQPEEEARYRVANREGRRYARWLDDRCRTGRAREALDDARNVYRLPMARKLERIARAA